MYDAGSAQDLQRRSTIGRELLRSHRPPPCWGRPRSNRPARASWLASSRFGGDEDGNRSVTGIQAAHICELRPADELERRGREPSKVTSIRTLCPGARSELAGLYHAGDVEENARPGPEDLLNAALAAEGYSRRLEALRVVVRRLLAEGEERDQLYETIGGLARNLGDAGREEDQDVLESILDELSGWCPPGSEL